MNVAINESFSVGELLLLSSGWFLQYIAKSLKAKTIPEGETAPIRFRDTQSSVRSRTKEGRQGRLGYSEYSVTGVIDIIIVVKMLLKAGY